MSPRPNHGLERCKRRVSQTERRRGLRRPLNVRFGSFASVWYSALGPVCPQQQTFPTRSALRIWARKLVDNLRGGATWARENPQKAAPRWKNCIAGAGLSRSAPISGSPLQRAPDKLAVSGADLPAIVRRIGHGRLIRRPPLRQDACTQERLHDRGVRIDDGILRKRILPDSGNAGLRRRRPESGDKPRKERGRAILRARPMLAHHQPQLRDACAGLRYAGWVSDIGRRQNCRRREFQQCQRGVELDGSGTRSSATAMVYRDVSEAFWKVGDRARAVAVFNEGRAAGADKWLFMSSAARAAAQQPTDQQSTDSR